MRSDCCRFKARITSTLGYTPSKFHATKICKRHSVFTSNLVTKIRRSESTFGHFVLGIYSRSMFDFLPRDPHVIVRNERETESRKSLSCLSTLSLSSSLMSERETRVCNRKFAVFTTPFLPDALLRMCHVSYDDSRTPSDYSSRVPTF